MAIKLLNLMWTIALIVHTHSILLTNVFEILLVLAVCVPAIPHVAGCALIVTMLLVASRFLCIYCGKYFYKFPGGMQI